MGRNKDKDKGWVCEGVKRLLAGGRDARPETPGNQSTGGTVMTHRPISRLHGQVGSVWSNGHTNGRETRSQGNQEDQRKMVGITYKTKTVWEHY